MAAAHIRRLLTGLLLTQNRDDLLFAEPTALHLIRLLSGDGLYSNLEEFAGLRSQPTGLVIWATVIYGNLDYCALATLSVQCGIVERQLNYFFEEKSRKYILKAGWFVELPDQKGLGKVSEYSGGYVDVSIFLSIGQESSIRIPLSALRRAFLAPQTRAYVDYKENICVGRVVGWAQEPDGSILYEVKFPNGKKVELSETELYVRPWSAPADPSETLADGGAESQFLHDRRQSGMAVLQSLISASEGLTALVSSGVDLVPHQVAAVRRVLNDPVQRYLLADEVGLGKTIEAGLVVRQHLIDDPANRALIAAPVVLLEQWRTELNQKLRLDQFGDCFDCVAHEDLGKQDSDYPILVIDEAHHLVGDVADSLAGAAERLRDLAADAKVLLLLSATPPIGEERRFLAMLNLLDPLTYRLDDIESFKAKLAKRQPIGRLLLSLDPAAPGLVLRKRGEELERLYPNDPVIRDLVPQLADATRMAPERLPALCSTLKQHVADGYRIHQRVIRSRRADAQGWEFRPRGPWTEDGPGFMHLRVEEDDPDSIGELQAALEDWRYAAVDHALQTPSAQMQLVLRYRDLLAAFARSADALVEHLRTLEPLFPGEAAFIESLRDAVSEIDPAARLALMAESTTRLVRTFAAQSRSGKVVVFASSAAQASAFRALLADWLPSEVLCLRLEGGVVDRFREASGLGVLVADRSGEEGVNLSFADAVVHLDLPFSVARIEQRIGRLDRYGRRKDDIRHRIHLPSEEENSPWGAWYDLLAQGFMIFHRSISDIQFLLDGLERHAFSALFFEGAAAVTGLVEEVKTRIEEERASQDEQYALDSIALAEDPVEPYLQAIEDAEEDEAQLEADIEEWLVKTLMVRRVPAAWPEPDPFILSQTPKTLVPRSPWLEDLLDGAAGPMTWYRQTAVRDGAVSLLRPGNPCIDSLYRYTLWDDRGTAFITLRRVPEWEAGPWVGYKLCFVVEADLAWENLLSPTIAELAMARRAQRYLPISNQVMYVDIDGNPVTDPALLVTLQRPYFSDKTVPGSDVNLGSRPELLAEIIGPEQFARYTRVVRDGARAALMEQEHYVANVERATRLVEGAIERHQNRLGRAIAAGSEVDTVRNELALLESLRPALARPNVRLEAMGCFVIMNATAPDKI